MPISCEWGVCIIVVCVHVCMCVCVCAYILYCTTMHDASCMATHVAHVAPHSQGHGQVVRVVALLFISLLKANSDVVKLLWFTSFERPKCGAHFLKRNEHKIGNDFTFLVA